MSGPKAISNSQNRTSTPNAGASAPDAGSAPAGASAGAVGADFFEDVPPNLAPDLVQEVATLQKAVAESKEKAIRRDLRQMLVRGIDPVKVQNLASALNVADQFERVTAKLQAQSQAGVGAPAGAKSI